jgi:starvation-inducible DNA-binding protein
MRMKAKKFSPPPVDTGIGEKDREKLADGLVNLLADTFTLYLKTHNFHWNVIGPQFRALHLMFEEQYKELWEATDDIAERVRALGYPVPATFAQFAKRSSIKEAAGVPEAQSMLRQLRDDHESLARSLRAVIAAADKADDASTSDLLTGRLESHEKTAWMLRSMLKE